MLGHPVAAGTQVVLLMHYYGQRDEVRDASAKLDGVRSATSLETGRKVGYWTDAHKFDPHRWIVDGVFDPSAGRASGWVPLSQSCGHRNSLRAC